ncbi:MAG: hypothetical protein ACQERC_07400 [Bacteroidota bacterium]
MQKLTKKEFRSRRLKERYKLLLLDGTYIGGRQAGVHRIYLYSLYGFYVELWIIISLDQVHWIEIQDNHSVIQSYSDQVNFKLPFD